MTKNHIPKPGCKNPSGCEVMDFFNQVSDLATEIPDIIIEDETFVTYTKLCYQNISSILDNIRSKKDTFAKLPKEIQDMFLIDTLFDNMNNLKPLYDKEPLYRELSKVTEWELMQKDLEDLKSNREKLVLLKSVVGNSEYFQNRKNEIISEIDSIREEVNSIISTISSIKEEISSKESELKLLNELKESLDKKDSLDDKISTLQSAYDSIQELAREKIKYLLN